MLFFPLGPHQVMRSVSFKGLKFFQPFQQFQQSPSRSDATIIIISYNDLTDRDCYSLTEKNQTVVKM